MVRVNNIDKQRRADTLFVQLKVNFSEQSVFRQYILLALL